ncbi:uncharacterized protein LOC142772036 [Rhipicephalus microplus]|uniref:uncharacterized protein LOC142772036 n=1 Tax=Rhipicephalus microplus TaxID=6941 RepID=UPI003F6BD3A3
MDCAAHVPKSGTCPFPEACSDIGADFLGPPHPLCDATPERLRKAVTTSTATTVDNISLSSKHHPSSGHGMAAVTMVARNHFCLFTQNFFTVFGIEYPAKRLESGEGGSSSQVSLRISAQ